MRCETAKTLLSPFLDGALAGSEREEVGAHVALCTECGGALDSLRALSRLIKSVGQAPLPRGFLERLEKRRSGGDAPSFGSVPVWVGAFAAASLLLSLVRRRPPTPYYESPASNLAAAPGSSIDALKPAGKDGPLELSVPAKALSRGGGGQAFGARQTYSNEALHKLMQEETKREGLRVAPKEDEDAQREPFLGREELGVHDTREQAEAAIRQIAAARHDVERGAGKKKSVQINGKTAPVLAQADAARGGQALEPEAAVPTAPPMLRDAVFSGGEGSGAFSGGLEGTRTITDEKGWLEVWAHLSSKSAPPIDFKTREVVAVFLGPRPSGGYAVQIASVGDEGPDLVVRWREVAPPPGQSPPEGKTSPFALKSIPRTDLPVRYEKVP